MATPAAVLSLLVKAEGATAAASQLTALDAVAKRTSAQMDTAGAAARRAGTNMSSAGASAGKAAGGMKAAGDAAEVSAAKQARLEGANKKGRAAMDSVGRKAGLVAIGVGAIGAAAVNSAANYEKSMNVLQSVSDATGSEMNKLSKLAIQLGADTKLPGTSAQDAAEAMTEMVKAGVSLKDTMSGVRGVLVLSAAAGVDNARAAEIASNALNVFKLRGSDVNMVIDQLANTANSSSVEINDVADSFKMAGAVFNAFQSPTVGAKNAMMELNVAIGLLGNAGIKGSDAGTSLKQMLLQLTGPSEKSKSAMRALYLAAQDSAAAEGHLNDVLHGSGKVRQEALKSIEKANPALKKQGDIAYDAAGRMRSLNDIVGLVAQGTKGMTQEQRNAYVTQIFGADATRAVTILMKAHGQEWGRMSKAVQRHGAAQDLANSKMKGFKGSLEALKSTMETLAINVGTKLLPAMTALARAVTDVVGALSPTAWVIAIGVIGGFATAIWALNTAWKVYTAMQLLATAAMEGSTVAAVLLNAALAVGILGALVLIAGALFIAYKKFGLFHDIVDTVWDVLVGVFNWVKDNWPLLLAILTGPFGLAALLILKHIDTIKGPIIAVFNWIKSYWPLLLAILAGPFGLAVYAVIKNLDTIKAAVSDAWNAILGVLKTIWAAIVAAATLYFKALLVEVTLVTAPLRAVLYGAWVGISTALKAIWSGLVAAARASFGAIRSVVVAAFNAIKTVSTAVWSVISAILTRIWTGLERAARTVFGAIRSVVVADFKALKAALDAIWGAIRAAASKAWGLIRTAIVSPVSDAIGKIKSLIGHGGRDRSGLIGFLANAWDTISDGVGSLGSMLKDKITSAFTTAVNAVIGFVRKIIGVINLIPGLPDIKKPGFLAKGGTFSGGGADQGNIPRGLAHGGAFARTRGVVNSPITLMGEEAPRHPEYVIPTNPAYRKRAHGLLGQAAGALGMAQGGIWSIGELEDLWKSQGGPASAAHTMAIVATAESGVAGRFANQTARNRSGATGLWQILGAVLPGDLTNPAVNARNAIAKWRTGGLGPWVSSKAAWGPLIGAGGAGLLRSLGGAISGAVGAVGGIIGDLASKGADFLLDKLPGTGGLPDWLKGTGSYVLGRVGSFIKDKVSSALAMFGGGGGEVSTTGLVPQVKRALAWARSHGWGGSVTSGLRSRAEQAALYGRYLAGGNLAAAPGTSSHEKGQAVDVTDPAGFARALSNAPAGSKIYNRLGAVDPVHFSVSGYRKGGVYPYAGSFGQGGTVPGPKGSPSVAVVHGGEQILAAKGIKFGTNFLSQYGAAKYNKASARLAYAEATGSKGGQKKALTTIAGIIFERIQLAQRILREGKAVNPNAMLTMLASLITSLHETEGRIAAINAPAAEGDSGTGEDPNQPLIDAQNAAAAASADAAAASREAAEALNGLRGEVKRQTDFATSVVATEGAAMSRWVTEVVSKQMGFNLGGKSLTPSYGAARRA